MIYFWLCEDDLRGKECYFQKGTNKQGAVWKLLLLVDCRYTKEVRVRGEEASEKQYGKQASRSDPSMHPATTVKEMDIRPIPSTKNDKKGGKRCAQSRECPRRGRRAIANYRC